MTNAKSIHARLLNISRKEKVAFQIIIFRYLHERLLYRISISNYANMLFLKGGNFLYATEGFAARPTKDIDLLGAGIENDVDNVEKMFQEICNIEYANDFAWFDTSDLSSELITEQNKYNGVRLLINSGFDTIRQQIQIDVGFGDIIIPEPQRLDFPVLLNEMNKPILYAYSAETVIAEKFHAMIELSTLNSRMKDFFDVYKLLISKKIDMALLEESIIVTFTNRQTLFIENHSLFNENFAENKERQKMWKAFLNKINIETNLEYTDVMKVITDNLKPYWLRFNK